jgi:hypothetical protein
LQLHQKAVRHFITALIKITECSSWIHICKLMEYKTR